MKKKTMKKQTVAVLVAGLMITLFTGCGSSATENSAKQGSTTATLENTNANSAQSESADAANLESTEVESSAKVDGGGYTVHYMYLVAQEGADQDAVEKAVDELAMKELNMHVDLIPVTIGTWNSQLPMMLASGEPLDIFIALSNQFSSYIDSGYVVNLADYQDDLKDAQETLGEDFNAGYIGDFLIGTSQMKERAYPEGIVVRKDIFEELGYSVDDFDCNTEDLSSYDKITEMYAKVKEKYPEMVCLDGTGVMGNGTMAYVDTMNSNFGVLENYGQTTTVTNYFESDQFKKLCEIAKTWYDNGYESKDIAVNKDSGELKMKAGNCFSFMCFVKPNTNIEKKAQTGYDTVYIPISQGVKSTTAVSSALFCVASSAEDPEKAAQFLNWTYQSREFNDLINWGIEGKDWVLTDDGMAAYPDGIDASTVGYHNDFGFVYPNQFAGHPWEGNPSDIWEQYATYNSSLLKSKAFGFNFDSTKVATQEAQLNSVSDQYLNMLAFGTVDIDSTLKEFNDALYAAGLQDVIDEKQAQLNAWLAEQK